MKPNMISLHSVFLSSLLALSMTQLSVQAATISLTSAHFTGLTPAEQAALVFIVEFTNPALDPHLKFTDYHHRVTNIIKSAIAETQNTMAQVQVRRRTDKADPDMQKLVKRVEGYNQVIATLNEMITKKIKNPFQFAKAFEKFEKLLSPTFKHRVESLITKRIGKRDLLDTFKARLNA